MKVFGECRGEPFAAGGCGEEGKGGITILEGWRRRGRKGPPPPKGGLEKVFSLALVLVPRSTCESFLSPLFPSSAKRSLIPDHRELRILEKFCSKI